jgi:hypothetical protein
MTQQSHYIYEYGMGMRMRMRRMRRKSGDEGDSKYITAKQQCGTEMSPRH